jgi:hypothetical protein
MEFGSCYRAQILVQSTSTLVLIGLNNSDPNSFFNVSGDSPIHMECAQNSLIYLGSTKINVIGTRNIGVWAAVFTNSVIDSTYASIAGAAGVTGQKYSAVSNGVINTGAGVNYFPGNTAGVLATGGQYT